MELWQQAERSLIKKYRKELWGPFITAIQQYQLVQAGDRIAVCISGGKDSMLMAKLMQELQRHGEAPFEAVFLCMDPGYNAENRKKIEENAALLHIPLTIFETDVFQSAEKAGGSSSPCYLCARMRRGNLYAEARRLGCNKIALGHHFNDVIETAVMSMFYGGQLQTMPPKLRSQNFQGMELIRPLYRVREADIIAWARYHGLAFIRCACRVTQRNAALENGSKRQEVKRLLQELKKTNPNIEISIFNSVHAVCLDTFPGYKSGGEAHSFLERYAEP
ncbi:MAG: tRNA 2-thiocytidine biosynthesis protein TtcA [Clostridia bacterium]|nr:tRNA 2-thiocytidine biosynthesis protein TtcA [Clostridia bacterium]